MSDVAEKNLGELRELVDGFAARIRVSKLERREYVLEAFGRDDREPARARCTELARAAARMRRARLSVDQINSLIDAGAKAKTERGWLSVVEAVDLVCDPGRSKSDDAKVKAISFADFAKEWTSGDLHKKHPDHVRAKDATRDKELLRLYIEPEIGHLPIDTVKLPHAERVMTSLPGELAPATRRQVAQCMRRVLGLAVYPGRHIAANPIPREWMPKVPKSGGKAKAALYPQEDAKLIACTKIDLDRRLAYAILIREGMRASELAGLRWRDVDLDLGRVRLDENKTDDPRAWMLSPDVVRALAWWKKKRAGDDVEDIDEQLADELVIGLDLHEGSRWLRGRDGEDSDHGDLGLAGVTRAELFERNKSRQPIRLHDLRASFVTISLANGRSEQWVTDRTGHRSSQMLANYTRQARTWAELGLGELGPMDRLIPEIAADLDDEPGDPPSATVCPTVAPQVVGHDRLELSANGLRVRCSTN